MVKHFIVSYDLYYGDLLASRVGFFSETVFHVRADDITSALSVSFILLRNMYPGRRVEITGIGEIDDPEIDFEGCLIGELDSEVEEDIKSHLFEYADLPSSEGLL